MTAAALIQQLQSGQTTSVEVVERYLRAIAERDGEIHAYLEVFAQEALAQAAASDERRRRGQTLSPLDGVPIAVKDNIAIKGHICSCASQMLANFVSPYDATVIRLIRESGMPILGRLNMDEFAMGQSTETSFFGPTKNPRDLSRVPGGSSGGSAAAVAAGMAPWALGSDTGGSVRQPAAFCDIVGVKPAYGAISRYGLVAFASSLDQIGVLAQTARDASLLLECLCQPDPRDMTSRAELVHKHVENPAHPAEITLGMPVECWDEGLAQRVGMKVQKVSIPLLKDALKAYYILSSAEASSNLARYDGVRYGHRAKHYADLDGLYRQSRHEGFGEEVKRRILLGTFALSEGYQEAYYQRAQAVREALTQQTRDALLRCDALLMPVSPCGAYRLGEQLDPVERYLGDIYTVPANLTGLAALAVGNAGLMGENIEKLLQIAWAMEGGNA